jgi:hypothetical protein
VLNVPPSSFFFTGERPAGAGLSRVVAYGQLLDPFTVFPGGEPSETYVLFVHLALPPTVLPAKSKVLESMNTEPLIVFVSISTNVEFVT